VAGCPSRVRPPHSQSDRSTSPDESHTPGESRRTWRLRKGPQPAARCRSAGGCVAPLAGAARRPLPPGTGPSRPAGRGEVDGAWRSSVVASGGAAPAPVRLLRPPRGRTPRALIAGGPGISPANGACLIRQGRPRPRRPCVLSPPSKWSPTASSAPQQGAAPRPGSREPLEHVPPSATPATGDAARLAAASTRRTLLSPQAVHRLPERAVLGSRKEAPRATPAAPLLPAGQVGSP
jgi:hypothetical protein